MFGANLAYVIIGIPLITAFIGLSTNWAAVKMIFHPEEFVGVWKIGWQGVLPSKADTFAEDVADNAVGKVLSAADLAEKLNPADMEALFADRLDDELPGIVAEVAEMIAPGVWAEMAPEAQQMVITQIKTEGRALAQETFDELQGISHELLDLRQLIIDLLSGPNVKRLVRLFQEIGGKELQAIVRLGGVFGLVVGMAQAGAFALLDQWWLMPIIGGVVGLGTNYLALQMIFRPLEPRRFFGVTYQGMFPRRQAEISHDYGVITAREILTPANLIRILTEGEAGTRIAQLVLTKVSERVDAAKPMVEMIAQRQVTDEQLAQVKFMIVGRVTQAIPELQSEMETYIEEQLDIANMVESRLAVLSKHEFERLMRGIFEQDEWILIAIGGALGAGVGLLQGLLLV